MYDVKRVELDGLCQECGRFDCPEEINEGQHSHPKYRIQRRVPDYDENVAGPLLAEDVGLATLRTECPHFGAWLRRLETLDEEAGERREPVE